MDGIAVRQGSSECPSRIDFMTGIVFLGHGRETVPKLDGFERLMVLMLGHLLIANGAS